MAPIVSVPLSVIAPPATKERVPLTVVAGKFTAVLPAIDRDVSVVLPPRAPPNVMAPVPAPPVVSTDNENAPSTVPSESAPPPVSIVAAEPNARSPRVKAASTVAIVPYNESDPETEAFKPSVKVTTSAAPSPMSKSPLIVRFCTDPLVQVGEAVIWRS